jgi:hypothetical protein
MLSQDDLGDVLRSTPVPSWSGALHRFGDLNYLVS